MTVTAQRVLIRRGWILLIPLSVLSDRPVKSVTCARARNLDCSMSQQRTQEGDHEKQFPLGRPRGGQPGPGARAAAGFHGLELVQTSHRTGCQCDVRAY